MHIIERTPDGYAWTVINTGEGVGFHPGCTRDDGSGEFRELPKARQPKPLLSRLGLCDAHS